MAETTVSCEMCSGTGDATHGDRHTSTNMDRCRTCGGTGQVPARPGEARETSWPFAVPGAERPADEVEAPDPDTSASDPIQILYAEPDQLPTVRTILLPVPRGELSHGPEGWWFAALDVEAREWRRILMSGLRAWGEENVAPLNQTIAIIREMFGRAIDEDGRLADASDAVDDLCDQVVGRAHLGMVAGSGMPETTLPGGEVERLVDALIEAVRDDTWKIRDGITSTAGLDKIYDIRTALLAVVRSSGGGGKKNNSASSDGVGLSQVEPASGLNPSDFDPSRGEDLVSAGAGGSNLSHSALTALHYAANVIQQDHFISNGQTALYWHLVGVAHDHVMSKREGVK